MSDLKTDDTTGDLVFENGDIALVSGADAVKQAIRQELRFFAGEWFLDLDYGVPYYKDVFIKNPNPQILEGVFTDKILNTPGVLELMEFNLDYDPASRRLSCSFLARGFDGMIDFSEVVGEQDNG
jgi:hypothetical protein